MLCAQSVRDQTRRIDHESNGVADSAWLAMLGTQLVRVLCILTHHAPLDVAYFRCSQHSLSRDHCSLLTGCDR